MNAFLLSEDACPSCRGAGHTQAWCCPACAGTGRRLVALEEVLAPLVGRLARLEDLTRGLHVYGPPPEEQEESPPPHPLQPLVWDALGTLRFRENRLVRFLLDAGPFDLNQIAAMDFSDEDQEQFAQLIGYSLSGFAELPYVSDATYERAEALAPPDLSASVRGGR